MEKSAVRRAVEKPAVRRASVLSLAMAAALALPGAVSAADWELNPRVEAGYLFDDNYRLAQPGNEIEVQGPLADASLEMRARNPAGEFSFTPRVRATYFPDETELDTVDYFANLYWLHQAQRLRTELRGEFSHQDIVNSEQPDAEVPDGGTDLGEADFGDAGRVFVDNRRTRGSIRPSMEYELSSRRSLEFGANVTAVTFDREIPGAQVDYNNADLTAGLITRVSPVSSFTARVRGARFDIDTAGDSDSYGVELQWDTRSASERRTFLRAGAQRVDFADGDSATAWLAGAGVTMPIGRNQLFFDLSRSVGPSSAGNVITRDQLRMRWSRDLTPRLALLAGVRGTHDEDVDEDSAFQPRSYATGDIGLQWRWEEEFSLRVAYDYTWQKFDDTLLDREAAKSSGAMVSVLYQPLQRRR
jgi:hypothetical protein